jgi:Na+/H+-dicarboxylate symporter
MCRTTLNVTGDLTIATYVAASERANTEKHHARAHNSASLQVF